MGARSRASSTSISSRLTHCSLRWRLLRKNASRLPGRLRLIRELVPEFQAISPPRLARNCRIAHDARVQRLISVNDQSILLSISGSVFHSARTASNDSKPNMRVHWPRPGNARDQMVTVIVPVYGDYKATRLCVESLLLELNSGRHRAILVDDATPDPQIAKCVAELVPSQY
jgi:hypothetical protein